MAAFTKILGSNLLTKDGSLKLTADLLEGKAAVAVYFSEQWCPPCQKFTPELVEKYNTIYKEGKNMEVVFVSCDDTEAELTEYYAKQPWLALPFAQRGLKLFQIGKCYLPSRHTSIHETLGKIDARVFVQ
eukprot:GEMP01015782.1.p1 GENE.GEMP01015782.1~~GEMP01015782.1.p1  ORF type:complete len:130 (+),score=28.61 GEMP01015782.1:213-602(+)